MFNGSMVALVTPMQSDGSIDKKSLFDLVEWHIAAKTDALVLTGTTGEGSTLTAKEQYDIIESVVTQAANRIPIIAGTGSNSTTHTIELTEMARKARANAALIVTPYYNKPTQAGLYEHFKTVAEQVTLPIILYNVPHRTAVDLLPETVEKLAKINTIIAIKEATGNVDRAVEIIQRCGNECLVYGGDDATAAELMLHGAKGVISVVANVAPTQMVALCQAALSGNKALTHQLNDQLKPLQKALFLEANPIPVKWALYEMGKIPAGIRLPLLPLDNQYRDEIKKALHETTKLGEHTVT